MAMTRKLHPENSTTNWRPNTRFWVAHLWLPLLFAVVSLYVLQHSNLDLWLADKWYAIEGHQWAWRNGWVSYDLIHHYGKQGIVAFGLLLIGLIVSSYFSKGLRLWRKPISYLLTSMALVPGAIAVAKNLNTASCPWDLLRYGGTLPYLHTLDYKFGLVAAGHCFPAGHASGGFALLGMYFAGLLFVRRPGWLLLPGILVGTIFALGQESRGAHFLSHDIWTLGICWFGSLGLFLLFRPWNWPQHGSLPIVFEVFQQRYFLRPGLVLDRDQR